ncbi:FtsQ-type POTRA domain-containing protein [bacterium]|nr:FtsQ-type POTRA domain-containing protein [bacterium]
MKRFFGIAAAAGYVLCTYFFVSFFSAAFCFAGDAFVKFKNSEKMLVTPGNVEINGNDRLSREDILFVTGLDKKISFFDADSKKMMLNLTTCGWVKKAFVEKFFPNSVKISIEEFKPVMIVNSKKKSPDSDKELFMMWFSDSDGILFKRAVPGEVTRDIPMFFLNYSMHEENKKRSEKIKKAIFISENWNRISSRCRLNTITYEVLGGYSLECAGDGGLKTVIHLKEEFAGDECVEIMQDIAKLQDLLRTRNQWAGEYDVDKKENDFGGKKYEIIYGRLLDRVDNRKGER